MKHTKLFSLLVITALSFYAVIGFYYLPLSSFEGDLTRMSKLSESLFGWTKPQPAIAPELLHQSKWQDADVLVVGDSFSAGDLHSNTMPYLWQAVLVKHGLRVHTESWESIRAICEDFVPWLKSQGFKGKYIVLENVERGAEGNLEKSIKCHSMSYRSSPYPQPVSPDASPNRKVSDYSGKLSVGIQTQLHTWEYLYLNSDPDFKHWELPNHVNMNRLSNGCELFSHPRCQDVLFLTEDRIQDFDEGMISKMAVIESRLKGFSLIWAIVPDKSTAYLNSNKQFWIKAEKRFMAPNMLQVFRLAIEKKTVDLYRGNNTHLSNEGFLIMGEAILKSMSYP